MRSKKDDLRPEYPAALIKSGERGKYAKRMRQEGNVVVIDRDLHDLFPDSASANRALRSYVRLRKKAAR